MDEKLLHRSCWLEVDLDAVGSNYRVLKEMVGDGVIVMPAVKANAYGHGIIEVGKELERCKVPYLGIGSIDEAILLRENGVKSNLLIFASNTVCAVADLYVKYDLIPTIHTFEQAKAISDEAVKADKVLPVFTKIETGRGRLGVNAEEFPDFIKQIIKLPNISIDGVYSHMGAADWPDKKYDYSKWQFDRFQKAIDCLSEDGINIPFRQLCNTPGGIAYPDMRMSGICPGRAMWGFSPLENRPEHPELKNALMAWKSKLILVKDVIGGKFGDNYKSVFLDTPKRIGIVSAGQFDGVNKKHEKGYVLIRGKKVPIACPISLEHITVDLTDLPEAEIGDEVVLMGKQGDAEITKEELMKMWDKTLIEFWIGLNPHLTRVYYKNGSPYSVAYGDKILKI